MSLIHDEGRGERPIEELAVDLVGWAHQTNVALKTKRLVKVDEDRNPIRSGNRVEDVAPLRLSRGVQLVVVGLRHEKRVRKVETVLVVDVRDGDERNTLRRLGWRLMIAVSDALAQFGELNGGPIVV